MKRKFNLNLLLALATVAMITISCKSSEVDDVNYEVLDNIDISVSENGVVPLPENLGTILTSRFVKYTKVVAPNGKPIHIFCQDKVSDLQAVKAREVLEYHLTEVPGSKYGSDKIALANKMGDNRATLIYTNTEQDAFDMYAPLENTKMKFQDLYATESPVEGDKQYLENGPGRDASYEEIMHLVHAKGLEEILPQYHQDIVDAEKRAIDAGVYKYGRPAPHEYIITGFDLYYGLWEHNPEGNGASFGEEYPYHTHQELKDNDPDLYDLVVGFWPAYLTYNAFIDPSFEGVFSLSFDEEQVYTFKSQYLVKAILTGNNPSGLIGNDQSNELTGNAADNTFKGVEGDDIIDGGEGNDVAIFSGNSSEYSIEEADGKVVVSDQVEGRDGTDVLSNIEVLEFVDKKITK